MQNGTTRIGVDLGGTKIEAVALDAAGNEVIRRRRATPAAGYDGTGRAGVELGRGGGARGGARPRRGGGIRRHSRDGGGRRRGDRRPAARRGQRHRRRVGAQPPALAERRSEERRVGKECRSRWSPYP